MGNKGFVYIITNDIFRDNCVKIGKTSKTPEERCLELYTGKSGVPIPFNVYAAIESEHYNEIEGHYTSILQISVLIKIANGLILVLRMFCVHLIYLYHLYMPVHLYDMMKRKQKMKIQKQ